jgi:hypothetical protein
MAESSNPRVPQAIQIHSTAVLLADTHIETIISIKLTWPGNPEPLRELQEEDSKF